MYLVPLTLWRTYKVSSALAVNEKSRLGEVVIAKTLSQYGL